MSIKNIWQGAGKIAREIVAKRVTICLVVGVILSYVVQQGWLDAGLSDRIQDDISNGILALGAIAGILWARQGVTTADPMKLPLSKNNLPMAEVIEFPGVMPGKPQPDELPHNAAA